MKGSPNKTTFSWDIEWMYMTLEVGCYLVSRARHNPHEIGVRAMYIPHPPSPTGPFIFPTFSEIGPSIFPTC